MRISRSSLILTINIIFGSCIDHLCGINVIRPVHRIPIRPLDRSTVQRLQLRPAQINPDSESIFPSQQYMNHYPLQIMERISLDSNGNRNRPIQDQFNVLNFDAYVMKPTNTVNNMNPVTERIFRLMNQTEYYRGSDTKLSPMQFKHRSKSASNKTKKPTQGVNFQFDDLEFYRAYLEHQKHAAMVKRLKPRPIEPSSRLPIGIEFFEQKKKNKIAFPPITYAPLYLGNVNRSPHHEEVVGASNIQNVKVKHPNLVYNVDILNESPTTPIPIIQTTLTPTLNENEIQSPIETVLSPNVHALNNTEPFHGLASEPQMYRFTIDDVIFKQPPPGLVNYPYTGPVTLPPPLLKYQSVPNSHMIRPDNMMPVSANTIHENQFDVHYPPKIIYEPNAFNNLRMNHQLNNYPYKNIPIEGASSHQEIQQFVVDLASITTQLPIIDEKESNDTVIVKLPHEIDTKRSEKRNKRRRLYFDRHRSNSRQFNHHDDINLELSGSYTKRRKQGSNSEDESETTPIIPEKRKKLKEETQPIETSTISTREKSEWNEKVEHFQYVFSS